jgi:hypothetical protein
MNEMKRRVAAILEFVNKMNGDKTGAHNSHASSSDPSGSRTPNGVVTQGGSGGNMANGNVQLPAAALLKGVDAGLSAAQILGERAEREFRDMGSGEMMHVLTRELVGWQSMYGKYGEK